MGQKINPRAIRISGYGQLQKNQNLGAFTNIWFSDYQYYSLLFQPFYIKKILISMLMKYYKNRVRYLKGRHRRLKSLFRLESFSCSYLPLKMTLLCSIHRNSSSGLQRKHMAFLLKQKQRLSKFKGMYTFKEDGKKVIRNNEGSSHKNFSYFQRLELAARFVWKTTLKNTRKNRVSF